MAHMICTRALRCYWECLRGTLEETFGSLIGTHTPLPPTPQPITSKLKRNNNNNNNFLELQVEPSRWLHVSISKIVCHHFQHKSLGTSSYCVWIEFIKSFVSFNFVFIHG
jgi:hypothetical protein